MQEEHIFISRPGSCHPHGVTGALSHPARLLHTGTDCLRPSVPEKGSECGPWTDASEPKVKRQETDRLRTKP
jgi:hypothetical protein